MPVLMSDYCTSVA